MFESRNPATQEVVWKGKSATPADIDKAVTTARASDWASRPISERIHFLEAFRQCLQESPLPEAISQETGKPLWESKTEVQSMIGKVKLAIEAYETRCKEIVVANAIARHKPHGVVAVFGPFNFPGHLPNGHIVPALLAGNCVLFKPSELTPRVAELTVECWQKAKLPPGVLQLLQGGAETGAALASHPGLDGLFFTGSFATGQKLAEQFAKNPGKILALEMGGNNPLVVSHVEDLEAAALATIQSAYLTAGQRCTCARRLIVVGDGERFVKELVRQIGRIRVGSYTDNPEPFMGPVISVKAAHKLMSAQNELQVKGGKIVVEMRGEGAFLTPGLMDVTNVQDRKDEELFGPFLQLIRVPDFAAALSEANNTQYGLCAGLLSDSEEEYKLFYRSVKAGVLNWNVPLTGASSALPFGGIKQSGNHRPSAYYAADYCSYPVASIEARRVARPDKLPIGLEPPHT